jgi:hypothetical protein
MAGPTGDDRPKGDPAEPSAIRRAAGLPAAPGYLSGPRTPPSGVNPEVRKLVLLGVGLIACVIITLVLAPRHDATPAAPAAPKVEETAEERRQRVQSMFNGALSKVSDGADFDQSRAWLDVLKGLAPLDPDYVSRRAVDWLDWNRAVSEPATQRGSYVRIRGLVARVDTEKLVTPVGNITDVWRCYIGQPDGSEPKVVDLLKKPGPDLDLGRDVIDVDAVFFRLVGYDLAKTGKKGEVRHIDVPYLIAQSATIYVPPARGPQGTARVVLLAGLVVGAVLVAVFVARQRVAPRRQHPALLNKPGVGIREMFEMRRREGTTRPPPPAPKTP